MNKCQRGQEPRIRCPTLVAPMALWWAFLVMAFSAWGQDGEGDEEVNIRDANLRGAVEHRLHKRPIANGAETRDRAASPRYLTTAASPVASVVPFAGDSGIASDDHGDTLNDATSLPLGSALFGRIDRSDDKDYFRVNVDETAEVAVFGRSSESPGVLIGRLVDEAGVELDVSGPRRGSPRCRAGNMCSA